MESFLKLKKQYNSISIEIINKEQILEYKKQLQVLISEYKDIYNIYLIENDKKYLYQAFEFYLSKIKPLANNIKHISYKYNEIDQIENESKTINYVLIQKKKYI